MGLDNKMLFEITTINWERIFFNFVVKTDYNDKVDFAFVLFKDENEEDHKHRAEEIEQIVPIEYDQYSDGEYTFSLNVSAIAGRSFLDNGRWKICAMVENKPIIVNVTNDVAYELDGLARVFRYGKNKYAYSISFDLDNFDEENLELCVNSYFMIENKKWKKRKYIQEAITFQGKIKRTYMFAVIRLIRIFYHVMSSITPKNGTRVLFMTETKGYLWGNLKYINDRLIERGLDKKFKISYSCRKSVGESNSALSWIKTVYLVAKQDYIFIDDYAPIFGFFRLNPKTELIQVWHAGEGFKSVGYSRFGKDGSPFPSESCHKAYTYALTGSKNLVKVYEEVFGIEKSAFLPIGMARLDDFLDEEKIENFKNDFYNQYPQLKDKRIVLFAPTFRGTGQKTAYYDYDKIDLKRIYEFCGDEWAFIIKMHPFVKEPIDIPETYKECIFDFASYQNINDLYYVTDVLITDYSSNYYEYALLKKPVLFYTYDREFYELTRGVHRDVKSHAPGRVCDTFDELMDALENGDFEKEKIDKFVEDNFGEYDGHAADKAIDIILLKEER